MVTAATLTKSQKAAAILVAMGKPAASRLLKFFKQDELKALIVAARQLKTIPQSELERIVAEFEGEFTEGVGQMDSGDQMDALLSDTLSSDEMDRLMGRAATQAVDAPKGPPPIWDDLEKVDSARLGQFLASENPQIGALVLSKVGPQAAASALMTLDKPMRGEIIKRMVSIGPIADAAVKIVENQLRARVFNESAVKDNSAGQARVATLLNELDKDQLDEMLADMQAVDTPGLEAIRGRLFSFEDILLLTQKARVTLFDGLSTELLTLALRQAQPAMVEAILSSIGARSRRMIEAELGQGADGIAMADIVKARKQIAGTAIRMAREGAFELPAAQNAA